MRSMDEDLKAAVAFHDYFCSGMVIGVRMARLGLEILGIDEPKKFRNLIVFVEMNRCATDAISIITGCTLGRRTLKVVDYGKTAATFVNLSTPEAVRVASITTALPRQDEDVLTFWEGFQDEEVLRWEKVFVEIPPEDLPGRTIFSIRCEMCGEQIQDCRDVTFNNMTACKACAGQGYYQELTGQEVNGNVENL